MFHNGLFPGLSLIKTCRKDRVGLALNKRSIRIRKATLKLHRHNGTTRGLNAAFTCPGRSKPKPSLETSCRDADFPAGFCTSRALAGSTTQPPAPASWGLPQPLTGNSCSPSQKRQVRSGHTLVRFIRRGGMISAVIPFHK